MCRSVEIRTTTAYNVVIFWNFVFNFNLPRTRHRLYSLQSINHGLGNDSKADSSLSDPYRVMPVLVEKLQVLPDTPNWLLNIFLLSDQ